MAAIDVANDHAVWRRHALRSRFPHGQRCLERHDAVRVIGTCQFKQRLERHLRIFRGCGQIVCDERDAQVFLHVNRRGLEPGDEGRALGLLERSGLVGNEPGPRLLGDRGCEPALRLVSRHHSNRAIRRRQ